MSASTNANSSRVITHPDGSIQIGDVVHKPWPSLAVLPTRSFALSQEIIWAAPGSPYHEFASRIPDYIRKAIRSLPNFQWSLLELAAANPKAGYRLLRDYPALAALIARRYAPAHHGDRTEYLRSMLARPLPDILRELGLPVRPRTLRILGMLPREHCYVLVVNRLADVLQKRGHPWIHVVPHLARITRDTVSLLVADPKYVNAHLLRASVESDYDSTPVFSTMMSVRQLLAEVRRKEEGFFQGVTFALLKTMEGRLYNEVHVDLVLPFPEPPIPGYPGAIEPIRDYAALIDEGEDQRHCVSTMVGEVVRGEFYAYRVLSPSRATLVLERGDPWQIHDLRAANNACVPSETRQAVIQWLTRNTPRT